MGMCCVRPYTDRRACVDTLSLSHQGVLTDEKPRTDTQSLIHKGVPIQMENLLRQSITVATGIGIYRKCAKTKRSNI